MAIASPQQKRDWESTFTTWAKPPSETEQEKCARAVAAIKQAISNSTRLAVRSVETFAQGSYANRVNVRGDSDVDVCVLCSDSFYYDLPPGAPAPGVATYLYPEYKNDVEAALVDHFGRDKVRRGNKAFDIHENTYRIDADAVPCFAYRKYFYDASGQLRYHPGTALITDREGKRLTNFPRQQYDNGVAKNEATARRFKQLVRILKNLRNEMDEVGIAAARPIASFLIESLVWNVPNQAFGHPTLTEDVRIVLAVIYDATKDGSNVTWYESNGIKELFTSEQEWTRKQVNDFTTAAWAYIGL